MTGTLTFVSVPGFQLEVAWLFADEKPSAYRIAKRLIEAAEAEE